MKRNGFTLVEVLVVLVITSLVSTLLFQALSQVYRLHERSGVQLTQSQAGVMRVDWYRQLLQGLQSDYADGPQKFRGSADRLQGLSATALNVNGGEAQWFELVIASSARGGELSYDVGASHMALLDWAQRGSASFAYLDDAGQEFAQWPPEMSGSTEVKPQLPAAILLKLPGAEGPRVLVAVPRGTRDARLRQLNPQDIQ
jgi:general secretion pathway protein J